MTGAHALHATRGARGTADRMRRTHDVVYEDDAADAQDTGQAPAAPTKRAQCKRQRRQHAAAATCGDAIPVNASLHRVQRQRAEERHNSASYPAWCMYKHVEAAGGWDAIPANEHFRPTLPVINNVVATAQCVNCVPDMRRLVWLLGGRRSHGEFARPVTASLWCEGATVAIQTSTGILNITGNKSPGAAVIACWAYIETVARHLHVPLQLAKFDVFNAQATFSVGGYIDLHALHRAVPLSNYEPELISHVSITIRSPRVTVLVWASGAVVVNGCRTREEHMRVYYDFGRFLSQFVRAGGGGRRRNARGGGAHPGGRSAPHPHAHDHPHAAAASSSAAAAAAGSRSDERGGRVHLQTSGAVGLRPTLWVR